MRISSSWLSSIGSFLTVATVTVVAISQVADAKGSATTSSFAKETQDFPHMGIIAVSKESGLRVSIDKEGNTDRSPLPNQQNISDCPERSSRPCLPGGSR